MNLWVKLAIAISAAAISSTALCMALPESPPAEDAPALAAVDASADARYVEQWIHEKGDDHGRPFVIVDKKAAHIYVFAEGGTLVGDSATLLGSSRGDLPVPGAGLKDPSRLLPDERKTPAGRFESRPGTNLSGEPVVWVDYDTGIAIHRVRPGHSRGQRLISLATPDAGDKRLSLGCVVVPEAFFLSVVLPTLGHGRGTVYVLPEDGPVQAMFADPHPGATSVAAVRHLTVSANAR